MGETDSKAINNPKPNYKLREMLGREPKGADIRIKGKCALVKMIREGLSGEEMGTKGTSQEKNSLSGENNMCKSPGAQ